MRGADNPPDAPVSPGERYGFVYEINYLRCIHCDLCVEACPTEAITETKLFEFSFTNRQDAIYTKRELLVDDKGRARRQPWELWLGGEDDDTSAWMRATSPSGQADYEGQVLWSGELGFGVRDPERGAVDVTVVLFFLFTAAALGGALGVVLSRNPVHSALFLVLTLVSVAVFFLLQDAQLVAAVQVIVYAGAIVVLFLFVIMLLGVDREESLDDPIRFQRPAAIVLGVDRARRGDLPRRPPVGHRRQERSRRADPRPPGGRPLQSQQHQARRTRALHRLPVAVRDHRRAARRRGGRQHRARPTER